MSTNGAFDLHEWGGFSLGTGSYASTERASRLPDEGRSRQRVVQRQIVARKRSLTLWGK